MPDDISSSAATTGAPPTEVSEHGAAEQRRRESSRDSRATPTFLPPTDIIETRESIILLLDLPGADPVSLDVTLDERRLTIRARARQEATPQGYSCIYAEYQTGNYERGFTLAGDVERERIDAVLKDGVLRLTLPKAKPNPPKKIEVKAS